MSHFAHIDDNGIVTNVIVAEQEFINSGAVGDSFRWIQCSYNGNFRKNYPSIGYTYDRTNDAFIAPKPHSSWILNEQTFRWEPPVERPKGPPGSSVWNEESQVWEITNGN